MIELRTLGSLDLRGGRELAAAHARAISAV